MTTVMSINNNEIKLTIAQIAANAQNGASLSEIEKQVSAIWAGDASRFVRQAVMLEVTGQRLGIAACGIKAVAKKIFELNQPVVTETKSEETPKAVKAEKAEKKPKSVKEPKADVKAENTEGVLEEVKPTASKPKVKEFSRTVDSDGKKIAYREDLTEDLKAVTTPAEFEALFAQLPENCGLVSRTAPYFTRDWTFRIISADEKTKVSMNEVVAKYEVHVNGIKDDILTTNLGLVKTMADLEAITNQSEIKVTNGKKSVPTGEGLKFGVMLICKMVSRTRLKTLATDFAIVELV
jgi:hypothetical protein